MTCCATRMRRDWCVSPTRFGYCVRVLARRALVADRKRDSARKTPFHAGNQAVGHLMRRAFFGRNPDRVVWKANFAADRSEICFLPLVPRSSRGTEVRTSS